MDYYGPLQLPVPAPSDTDTVADPLLDVLLAFFKSILNANASVAWAVVGGFQPGGNDDVVVETFTWNPEEESGTTFNSRDLPALFMWREEIGGSEWLAADYYVRPSKLQLLWVPPLTVEENRSRFRPFINAIASVIDGVTDPDGRDPSYKIPGDTDPAADYLGSLLWKQTPNLYSFDVGRSKPSTIKLATDSGEKPHYPCVRMEITIRERNTVGEPPDNYFELVGGDLLISDAGSGETPGPDDLDVKLGVQVVGINPSSGPIAGGTEIVILGIGFDDAPAVFFGELEADPTTITVLEGTTVVVSTPGTSDPGVVDVTVENANGDASTLTDSFTYV